MRQLPDTWTAREQPAEDGLLLLDGLLGRVGREHDVRAVALTGLPPDPAPVPAPARAPHRRPRDDRAGHP